MSTLSKLKGNTEIIFHYLKKDITLGYSAQHWHTRSFTQGEVWLTISSGEPSYCRLASVKVGITLILPTRDRIFVQFWSELYEERTQEIELEDFRVEPYMTMTYRELARDNWFRDCKLPLDNSI